jgi:hypothetical protein
MKSTLKPMVALVTVVLLGGALAGCTDSEASPPETPSSSTSAPSSPPTTAKPTEPVETAAEVPPVPAMALKPTKAGANSFVRYYIDLVNYARKTGNSAPLLDHAAGCQGCSNFADLYQRTYAADGYFRGAGWSVRTSIPLDYGKDYQVLAVIDVASGKYRESAVAQVEKMREKELQFRFVVSRDSEGWLIHEMQSTST